MTATKPEILGASLRSLRVSRGLSLGEASHGAAVSKASIVGWESGRYFPKGPSLARLLDVYEVPSRQRARLLLTVDPSLTQIEFARTSLGAPVVVGDVLRAMRSRRNITQADLARSLKVSQSTVARWESGDSIPDPPTIHRICFAIGASVEEVAALSCVDARGFQSIPEDSDEAMSFLTEALNRAERNVYEIVSLGLEAELWRRSTHNSRWDHHRCLVLAYRANHFFSEGRLAEIPDLAHRAIRMAKTPEMRAAATPAVGALAAIARHREENPRHVADAVGSWIQKIPTHGNKAWMMWVRAMRLATMGFCDQAIDLTECSCEMTARVARRVPGWEKAVGDGRIGALGEVYLAANQPEKAIATYEGLSVQAVKNTHVFVRVQHALGRSVPEEVMRVLRENAADERWRNWQTLYALEKIEQEQTRLSNRIG